jgi:20S proteasome alpha/beta subunit
MVSPVLLFKSFLGFFSASQSVKKIIEINPYMLGTMAGGAADCQFWHRNLGIKVVYLCLFLYSFPTSTDLLSISKNSCNARIVN